jgi:hypothetical protein
MSPAEWIERCEAVLAAGGLDADQRDFVVGVMNRKAWSIAKPRRREFLLSPDQYMRFAEIEKRVMRKAG